jgi:hypothetical protein
LRQGGYELDEGVMLQFVTSPGTEVANPENLLPAQAIELGLNSSQVESGADCEISTEKELL